MVGFAAKNYRSSDDLSFIRDYCTLTRRHGELQCICDEKGELYAIDTSTGIIELEPEQENINQLCNGILPLLENAKGSIVRTTLRPSNKFWELIPPLTTHQQHQLSATIYPVFQGKLVCEFYNVSFHFLPENSEGSDGHDTASKHRTSTGPSSIPYCIADARTGLFLESNPLFQMAVGIEDSTLMRSRCEEMGMKDLLLLATLNADRKCFFQSQFKANGSKHWFLSESFNVGDRECIRIWCPDNVAFPESHLTNMNLSRNFCSLWENKPERVLICDDNKLLVDTCCSIMDWAGIQYDIAANGKEALQKLEKTHYQCVFLDLNMPRLNGFDTARLIRQSQRNYKAIPIVAMTGTPLTEADLSRQLKHFDSILQKPFDIEDVKVSYNRALTHLEMKKRTFSKDEKTPSDFSFSALLSHQDYEPTPFMIQFAERPAVLEDLREHILSTLEGNLAFFKSIDSRNHPNELKGLVQRTQSMATSVGAWKLATHAGLLFEKLTQCPTENLTIASDGLVSCVEEALCFYNTVDWKHFLNASINKNEMAIPKH